MIRFPCSALSLAAIPLAAGSPASAQDASGLDDALARFSFSLTTRATFTAEADLDDAGSVGVTRLGPRLGIGYSPNDTSSVEIAFDAEFSFYDFTGATGVVPGGDPGDDFARYGIGARYNARIDDTWGWFVGGTASWAAESDGSLGDGFVASGLGGATYAINDRLTVGLGLVVRSRIEDDASVYPIPYFNWQIDDRWSLGTTDRALRLSYAPADEWTIFLQGGWESREFRLSESGPIPDGVMRDDRIPIELGALWRPIEKLELGATVGVAAYSSYEFLDSTGAKIADPEGDPALMASLTARLRF